MNIFENIVKNRILGGHTRKSPNGRSVLSQKPVALPLHAQRPPTLAEQVARLVRQYNYDLNPQQDTPDDDENWEGENDSPFSPYELVFDPILNKEISAKEFLNNQMKYKAAYAQKAIEENEKSGAIPLPTSFSNPPPAPPKAEGERAQNAGEPSA